MDGRKGLVQQRSVCSVSIEEHSATPLPPPPPPTDVPGADVGMVILGTIAVTLAVLALGGGAVTALWGAGATAGAGGRAEKAMDAGTGTLRCHRETSQAGLLPVPPPWAGVLLCPGVSPEVAPLECGALPTRCGSRMNPYSLYILHSAVIRVVHAVR